MKWLPPSTSSGLLELAGFLLALLTEPLEQPAHPVEVELHHVSERQVEAAAAVLVIEQPEEALPQLVDFDAWKQAIYRAAFAFVVGRKKPRSKGS